jgi:hypothetical protein
MAGYNLGNYASQLDADTYNRALANSGSQYRVPEQQTMAPEAPAMDAPSAVPEQPQQQSQWQQSDASQKAGLVGGLLGGGDGNKLGGILRLVGSFYGGGAGAAMGAAGSAADAQQSGDTKQKAGVVGGLLGRG